jgi:nucleoside-diphosphate-sugar epimerase
MFYKFNVGSLRRLLEIAKEAGIKHVVVLGSYFAYFDRAWKNLKLYETHPFIKSRVVQANTALSFADGNMDVAVLELPYIFGTQPGRKPVWVFMVEQIRKMKGSTMYPRGGTTMITVKQAGQCIAGALENNRGGRNYPVGYYNLTWKEMLAIFHKHMGMPDKRIVTIPAFLYRLGMKPLIKENKKKGIEPGLDLMGLVKIMTRKAFIDKKTVVDAFDVSEDDLDAAIGESVKLCLEVLDGRAQTVGMKGE